MPVGAAVYGAAIHNGKVYISTVCDEWTCPVLVYSTNEHKWNTLEAPVQHKGSAIAVVDNHITLIGGVDIEADEATNTLSTWYGEGRWKQVLPPMPTERCSPTVISHDNLLLVTGGVAEDDFTVLNTTDVLDLTTMKWTTPQGLNLPIPLWHHHLALCGQYLYLVGGTKEFDIKSAVDDNSQAWRVKWSDVKQTAAPQHSQPQRGVWTRIADPPTLLPTAASCGGTLYTVGGVIDEKPNSTVYTYNTARNQWVSVGDLSVGRAGHCAVPLSSTSMFVAGGDFLNEGKDSYSPLTELLLL